MNELTHVQTVKMDRILTILKKANQQNLGIFYQSDQFSKDLNISRDEAIHLVQRIIDGITFEGAPVVKSKPESDLRGPKIAMNFNTEKFLIDGGCEKWFNDQLILQEKGHERQNLEEQKLRNDIAAFIFTKKQFFWTIGIAIAALVTAIVGILLQILKII